MGKDPLQKAWRLMAMPVMLALLVISGGADLTPLSRPVSVAEGDGVARSAFEDARGNGCADPIILTPPGRPAPPPRDCRQALKDADVVLFWSDQTMFNSPRHVLALERRPARWPFEETWIALALMPRNEADAYAGYDFRWTACPLARLTARRLMRYAPRPGGGYPGPILVGPRYVHDGAGGRMLVRAGRGTDRREQLAWIDDAGWAGAIWRRLGPCRWRKV